jgi:putative ABC transport system permease protein
MWLDIRCAIRRLAARPGHTAVMILTLALGIGSTTAVYSVADALLFRQEPFAFADRLVGVLDANRAKRGGGSSLTPEKLAGWQTEATVFDRFEGFTFQSFDVAGDGEPQRVRGALVSTGLFSMLGVQPRLGRFFEEGDGAAGTPRVVIIGERLWRSRYGARSDIVGRTLQLDDEPHVIVGVAPRRFHLFGSEVAWVPVDLRHPGTEAGATRFYGIGRVARGLTTQIAQQRVDTIATGLQAASPLPRSWDLLLVPRLLATRGQQIQTALFVLLGVVALVLLIACANIASLLLSRAVGRAREIAVRAALGASRARLARDVLIESGIVGSAGGGFGVLFAAWGVPAVLNLAPSSFVWSNTTTVEVDGRVLFFAACVTFLTALLFGLVPALRGSGVRLEGALRGASQQITGRQSDRRLQSVLVIIEMALSMVLLVGAALMMRSLVALESENPGFDPTHLLSLRIELPTDRYPTTAARQAFFHQVEERVAAMGGVHSVADARGIPPTFGFSWGTPAIDGGRPLPSTQPTTISVNTVGTGYFATLGMRFVAGRPFNAADGENAIVVSTSMAQKLWPGGAALGHQFRFDRDPWQTVVGVVGDVDTRIGDQKVAMQMYEPFAVAAARPGTGPDAPRRRQYSGEMLLVRADDPLRLVSAVKSAVWAVDKSQPVEQVALVEDLFADSFWQQRFTLVLMALFAGVAVVIGAAGLFGVLSELVAQRTREIGVRIALGATPKQVAWLITSRGLGLAGIGTLAGIAGAAALTRVLGSLLVGVSRLDSISFGATAIFLMLVALAACWAPTRRASAIEPAVSLRAE